MDPLFRSFPTLGQWSATWEARPSRFRVKKKAERSPFQEIAHYVGGALSNHGYQLFQNGGMPLIEKRVREYRQEILLLPGPEMDTRAEVPFSVQVHLSSTVLAEIRSVYWKPPTRAPQSVAHGNLGQLSPDPSFLLFHGAGRVETAGKILELLHANVLPWFEIFHRPTLLRERIYTRSLPLVDDCTSVELLLAEFDPFEARSFVRLRMESILDHTGPVDLAEGFDPQPDRVHSVAAYYNLR